MGEPIFRSTEATLARIWGLVLAGLAGVQRNGVQRGERIHGVFRNPCIDQILNAVFRVQPVIGLGLAAAGKIQQYRAGHITLGQSDLGCLGAVDGKVQFGLVGRLLDPDIHGARDLADIIRQFSRDLPRFFTVPAHDLNIDRGRQPEIDGLIDDIGRQKIKRRSGKVTSQAGAQPADIVIRGPVIPVERNQNVRIAGSRYAVIEIGQRNAAAGDADIVQNSGKLPGGDHFPDHGFDAVHEPGGFFDAGSAGGADMQAGTGPRPLSGKNSAPIAESAPLCPRKRPERASLKRMRWESTAPSRFR